MGIKIVRTVKYNKPKGYGYVEVDRKVGKCECGEEVELFEPTNTCTCGREYNLFGQELAARQFWGEETGETAEDILKAGHHQM